MSRFIATQGSYFEPYSYDELVKPLQQMAEAHTATQDAYDQLSLETNALGRYISENEDDVQAKALYDNYVNKLNTLQTNLWNNGYTAASRKDLSAARSAYANDILRLQKAITDRQERSKEYWDYRHKNPDSVVGIDPGIGGLDNYLNDANFGRNWYNYNGTQFANEVATDLSARAKELQQSYISKGLNVPGYLEYVIESGFSNSDIDNGGALARAMLSGADVDETKFNDAEKLIAGVLIDHLQKSGARPGAGGNIADDEFQRLFNYGLYGATQSIKDPKRQMLSDKVWDKQMQFALATHNSNLRMQEEMLKNGTPADAGYGYSLDGVSGSVEAPDFAKKATFYNKNVHNYDKDGAVLVTMNGRQTAINNEEQAAAIFNAMGRDKIMQRYGVDPELQIRGRHANVDDRIEITRTTPDGKTALFRFVPMTSEQKKDFANDGFMDASDGYKYEPVAVEQRVNGEWVLNQAVTRNFNRENRGYQKQRDGITAVGANGKKVDVGSLAMVGEAKRKIYREGNIDQNVPEEFAQAVYYTKNRKGNDQMAIIADTDAANEYYTRKFREKYALEFSSLTNDKKGKASPMALYALADNRISYQPYGEVNPMNFFASKGSENNKSIDYGTTMIGATPEDIYNDNKIRFVTNADKIFGADPGYAGNYIAGVVQAMRNPIREDSNGIVHYLMLPMSEPEYVSTMNPAEQEHWWRIANNYLGQFMDFNGVGPQQILLDTRDGGLQDDLRRAVIMYMNDEFSRARDYVMLKPEQNVSSTSTKAQPYLPYGR